MNLNYYTLQRIKQKCYLEIIQRNYGLILTKPGFLLIWKIQTNQNNRSCKI